MKNKILILITFLFFVGCKSLVLSTPPVHEPSQIAPTIHSPVNIPTSLQNKSSIQSFCPEITSADNLKNLSGTIVLSGSRELMTDLSLSNAEGNSVILFWETQSGNKVSYPLSESQRYYYFVTSPNKNFLAFTEGKTLPISYNVIVLNRSGEETGRFNLPEDWTLFDWLNDEKILVRQIRIQNMLQNDKNELIAINPINGSQETFLTDFPNLHTKETLALWGALTVFDPTSSRVLYLKVEGQEYESVLWNIYSNKEIAQFDGGKWPKWSPSGNQLAIVIEDKSIISEELFSIDKQGTMTQFTSLKEYFKDVQIHFPVWSPNERYIAFWLSTSFPVETAQLAILDTETLNIDVFCYPINPYPFRFGDYLTLGYSYYQINSAIPIWSPDSNFLLVEDNKDSVITTYLFDLQNHTMTKLVDNARPVSWLK